MSNQTLIRPRSPWKDGYRHLGFWTQVISNDTWVPLHCEGFIWLPFAWRCTRRGYLPSLPYASFHLQHYWVSTKWHSAIAVRQHSPSPLASLLDEEDLASAMQMVLGLLGKMTQERGNMELQWDSALLSPRSRTLLRAFALEWCHP